MEHRTLAAIKQAGATIELMPLSAHERLECWAAALEHLKDARLNTLMRTEYVAWDQMKQMRADNSPLSIASGDPALKADGLKDDSFGEAVRFFEISEHDLHYIVCYCHWGKTMSAEQAAMRVRQIASERSRRL